MNAFSAPVNLLALIRLRPSPNQEKLSENYSPKLERIRSTRRSGKTGQNIALADTYGQASAGLVHDLTKAVIEQFGMVGVHLHARAENALALSNAALSAGSTWLEGALGGIGGCPFAGDELIGNLATELILPSLQTNINLERIPALTREALEIRSTFA